MNHYYCPACLQSTEELTICENEGCDSRWDMLTECACTDGRHGAKAAVKDAYGNPLQDGDSVTLVKDLTLRGTSQVIKRGTKVKGIRTTENPEEVDCRIDSVAIVLRTEFLKKL